jgi:hypothetical protein
MDDRVIVIGENNVIAGKTYNRRARQLISKQRAVWADETHTAILLSPSVSAHEWQEAEAAPSAGESGVPAAEDAASWDERRLYALAAKRVRGRKRFIWHTAALLPGYIALFMLYGGVFNYIYYPGADYILLFLLGVWTTAYAMHAYLFFTPWFRSYSRRSEAGRIKAEMEKLKTAGPKKIGMELERAEL